MKTVRVLFTTVFLAVASLQAGKSLGQEPVSSVVDAPNSVHFMGEKDQFLIFEVQLQDVSKGSTLRILDENGDELFYERIQKTAFVKVFKFAKKSFSKLQFNVRGKQQQMTETFSLNYKVEEKLEVSKI